MIEEQVERYFAFCRERYEIYLKRRAGLPPPWTDDPILQSYRFCNIFRETDRVTDWIRRNVRQPMYHNHNVVYAMAVCRFFNLPSTLKIIGDNNLFESWNPFLMRQVLEDKKPLITGAYMVKTPLRKPKLEGLIDILSPIWIERRQLYNFGSMTNSIERMCGRLQEFPWVGPFMSYQICRDLVYTSALPDPVDYPRWGEAGPGTLRGLRRLCSARVDGPLDEEPVALLQRLASLAQQDGYWSKSYPEMTLADCTTALCEWDKFERASLGEGQPKQRYSSVV